MKPPFPRPAALLLALLVLAGCRSTAPPADTPAETTAEAPPVRVTYTVVSDSVAPDPELAALVAPYRERLAAEVAEVVGRAAVPMEEDAPEGLLGNFATDAMLAVAREASEGPVHMALTNNGGLRVPIPAGPVTVGDLFELMPFENRLVVLTLTGVEVDSLAQQLARHGGEPIAGFSFKMYDRARTAFDVEVGGAPVDPSATYRLVTSDYLADGGGNMPVLWSAAPREELDVLLRGAFITYLRAQEVVEPRFEGRITIVDDEAYLR